MTQKAKTDGSDTTTFSWDSQNRLVALNRSVTGSTGNNGSGNNNATPANISASFKYDLFSRRVEKTLNGIFDKATYATCRSRRRKAARDSRSAVPRNPALRIYDGEQVIGEEKTSNTGGLLTTSVLAGAAIDEMIARYSNGTQSVYLTDALGSVIAQLKDDHSSCNQYGYSPYGMTVKGNNGQANPTTDDQGNTSQYTARENDGTGLYYYRARYYMPSCGRFISEDPIGTSGGINLYGYVGGDPINATDPMGLRLCIADLPGMHKPLLDEDFSRRVSQWRTLNEQEGIRLTFNEAFRSAEDQRRMSKNPRAITPAKPGNSWHEAGRAVDVNISRLPRDQQQRAIANARLIDLQWGGNFKEPDRPHFQWQGSNKERQIRATQQEYDLGGPFPLCP
jgi:RHS repeat-associated protein